MTSEASPDAGRTAATVCGGRARALPWFRIALAFAVLGQPAAAGLLALLDNTELVDFRSIDPDATAAFYLLAGVFVAEIALMLIALAHAGVTFGRILAALAALLFAFGLLMLLFVALQCSLYGACL